MVSERGDLSIENERGGDSRETSPEMDLKDDCHRLEDSQKLRITTITTMADEETKSTMLGSDQPLTSSGRLNDYDTFKDSTGDGRASMCS